MGKHDHKVCEHVLEYCEICDVVYCTKCNKEWYPQLYAESTLRQSYGTITYPLEEQEKYPFSTCLHKDN